VPHADCNDQRLYYEVHGEGDPLLCVHGLSIDTLGWALQVPSWSSQYRTIVFDNRDVGRSSRASNDYEIADMAADVIALADQLGLERFHLLGLSMGGAIAQELALTHPDRVQTLTLCVTFGGGGAWGRTQARAWSRRALAMTREERIDELMLLCFSERFYENEQQVAFLRQALLANPNPQEPEAFVRQLNATARHEARERLGQLAVPTHVIGAELDVLLPVWKSRELAALIPGAELTVLAGAAHGANLEHAEAFNAAVLGFLAATTAAAA
jgi:3-oxoadipate enol-lactonase